MNNLTQAMAGLLGLTDYEARAYLALLRTGPMTSYAVAKAGGIPISKSYEAVEGLARKGGAVLLPGDPTRHAAIPPDALLEQTRLHQTQALDELGAALATLAIADAVSDPLPLWRAAPKAGLAQAAARIAVAQRSIVGALPPSARDALESVLAEAARRGILTQLVASSDLFITLLLDDREAIVGSLDKEATEIIGTANPAIVALCRTRLRAAAASPFLRPAEDVAEWLRWEEEKGLRLLRAGERH